MESVSYCKTRLALTSVHLEYICRNSFYPPWCIGALFRVRIPFQCLVQRVIQIPVRQSRVPFMFTQRSWEIDTRDLPIFILWLQSLKTPETPGLSITFGTLSACRSFETKDYWTFFHCFYRISLCSRVYIYVFGIAHGKNKSTQNAIFLFCSFSVGHRYHLPCFHWPSLRELLLISYISKCKSEHAHIFWVIWFPRINIVLTGFLWSLSTLYWTKNKGVPKPEILRRKIANKI